MRRFGVIAALLALMGALGCRRDGAGGSPDELSYDGSTTITNRILPEALPRFEEHSGHRFRRVATSGTGKGLEAALAGEVSVAGVSRPLTPAELSRHPYAVLIGYDALGVFVNARNPVKGLTRAQLKAIFTGKVRSWRDLGGDDLPVVACTEPLDSRRATLDHLRTTALDGDPYAEVAERPDPADCLRLVVEDPRAVTAATISYAIPGARWIAVDGVGPTPEHVRSGDYLLTRPLLLVTREPPRGAVLEFFDFMLSPEGQRIVSGKFVPIR